MGMGPWVPYNDFKANLLRKTLDMDSDTFKVALFTSSSNCGNAALVGATYSALTNEVANGSGYTTAGATAGTPTIAGGGATATITWDTANVAWTASGGSITARFAVIYDSTTGDLVAYALLDSTPANVTIADGFTGTITIANVFSLA